MAEATPDRHVVFLGPPNFIVFNNEELPDTPIVAGDLEVVSVQDDGPCASAAWSSDCEWYFVIQSDAMLLLNTYSGRRALRCRRKTSAFIAWFLDSGLAARSVLSGRPHGRKAA